MPKQELLPGVSTDSCPPRVMCDAHAAIRAARRRALWRDGLQLSLLLAVDYLFVHWPESRLPMLDRSTSLAFLRGTNVAIMGHVALMRALPKWTARRISATWCRSEREKFQG
jgi:hypothetical protein